MTFKKGEKVLTEDGEIGEILFIDRGGLEAQVALTRISTKIRCDSLKKFEADKATPPFTQASFLSSRDDIFAKRFVRWPKI